MNLDFNSDKPIFLQISEGLADDILSGIFPEESQTPSITEFSVTYKINPATAPKGINQLVDQGIIYKKRGIGMFVSKGAVDLLKQSRRQQFFDTYIIPMTEEARRLGLSKEDIEALIRRGFSSDAGDSGASLL